METPDIDSKSNGLSNRTKSYLLKTAKWAKFLSIVGFIVIGITAYSGIRMLVGGFLLGMFIGVFFGTAMQGIGYVLASVLCFFPTLYLFKFASKIKSSLQSSNLENLEDGFGKLKSLFKFMGILTIVILTFYIFSFALLAYYKYR